jgi:hypothetical protein
MNDLDNQFEPLCKLLSLKRHEVPPPGYFDRFSGQVISRIQEAKSTHPETPLERLFAEAPWVLNLLQAFQARPAMAGFFASAVCLLIVGVLVATDQQDTPSSSLLTSVEPPPGTPSGSPGNLGTMAKAFLHPDAFPSTVVFSNNSAPSMEPTATPFNGQTPAFQTLEFKH